MARNRQQQDRFVQIPGGDVSGIVEETGADSKVRPKQSLK